MTKLSLDDLSVRFDPEYVIQDPFVIYNRPLPRKANTFIITAAQNATPVHPGFWATLLNIAKHTKAEILVGNIRYKNPTSQWSGSQQNVEHWDKLVRPYLWNQRLDLNPNLTFLSDIRVQPTNASPLTGLEAMSEASSSIVPHPRIQTRSVATPHSKTAKLLWTTGACTLSNYTDSRVGRLGKSHHSLSALIVEIVGRMFFVRRLHWDEVAQSVVDIDTEYTTTEVRPAPNALAVITGDTHVRFISKSVYKATYGKGGIVEAVKPSYLIYHDLLDAYSVNPHHKGNPFVALAKNKSTFDNVEAEVREAINFVVANTPTGTIPVVVNSNHDDMLSRWIKINDWRLDPVNSEFYLETALAMVRSTKMGKTGTEHISAFGYWLETIAPRVRVLGGSESFYIGGHELGFHGDKGPNGARGSIKNMRRLGSKVIIGHTHSPGEDEGALQVGTSTELEAEYTKGAPSSWMNAHAILHQNNFTQLLILIEGKYRR